MRLQRRHWMRNRKAWTERLKRFRASRVREPPVCSVAVVPTYKRPSARFRPRKDLGSWGNASSGDSLRDSSTSISVQLWIGKKITGGGKYESRCFYKSPGE